MRSRGGGRLGGQSADRVGEPRRRLRRDGGRRPFGGERRRAETEEPVARAGQPFCEPCRPVLGPAVLGEPPRQLLRGRLGLELGELGVLVREEAAGLQLEQRGDEDEELAAGVEVEAVALGEMLDERDDHLCEIDLAEREARRGGRASGGDRTALRTRRGRGRARRQVLPPSRQASPPTGRGLSGRSSGAAPGRAEAAASSSARPGDPSLLDRAPATR